MQCAKANTSESCKCICLFSEENISVQIIQLIKQDRSVEVSLVEQPTISSNTAVLLTHSPTNGVLVLSFLATFVRVTFQSFPNGTTSTTTSPCQCQKIFAILQKIFVLKKVRFNANICKEHGLTCEESNAVHSRMTELFYLKDTMASLVTQNESPSTACTSISDIFTNELQETRQRYNEELKELYDLLQKNVCAHSLESGSGNVDSHMELQVSQQNRSSGDSASSQTTQSQGRSRDIPRHQTNHFPLTRLLHYFAINLLPNEWHELRLATSRCIPLRQRSNLPNGMGIFDELVNRKLISHQNLDLLHQIFTEVERFDYVHLIDRVKEGDNSLLDQWYEDQRLPTNTGASNSQSVATVQEIRRSTVKEHRAEDASSFQRKQDITGGSLADQVSRDLKQDIGRYKNSPPVPQVSLTIPMQEVSARVEVDGDFSRSRNGDVRVTSPATQPQQQTSHHSKTGSSHAGSNQTGNNQAGSNHTENNQAGSNQAGSNQAGSNHPESNQAGSNPPESNHSEMNHTGSSHTESNQVGSKHTGSNRGGSNQGKSIQSGSNHNRSNQGVDRSTNQGDNHDGSNQAGSNRDESGRNGSSQTGSNRGGSSHDESSPTGSSQAGSDRGGSSHDGSSHDGSSPTGSSQAGSDRGGSSHDGSSPTGSSQAGSDRGGSSHDGSNRDKQAAQGLSGGNKAETKAKLKFSCEHYDRYCHVQFSCCDKFWSCHRCHNMENKCGNGKLRSIDIKKIKCSRCQKIQEFPKERPHCEECGLKFAEYFCASCQHLTGRQCNPYHCIGCGICRINEDRSFHCDVCGVCLDVHLLENHKCRAGSAHDECCICFEDAFTGCQILPCSHKVHKDCATEMLKNGITKCPVCRQSFAHLVQRRQPENSSK